MSFGATKLPDKSSTIHEYVTILLPGLLKDTLLLFSNCDCSTSSINHFSFTFESKTASNKYQLIHLTMLSLRLIHHKKRHHLLNNYQNPDS